MGLVHLTNENFNHEVLKEKLPVLVDFWAQWCGPCKVVTPVIEELAKEYQGRLKVAKLNVDEANTIASHYAIMSILTLILFKEGKAVTSVIGALSKDELEERIQEYL